MDAIKKKMNSLKAETVELLRNIAELEDQTKRSNDISDKCELDVREIGKKTARMEAQHDESFEALISTEHKLEEKEKALGVADQDISSLCRRLTLLESESWTAESRLGNFTIDLANTCKLADDIQRRARYLEAKCMSNEVNMEDLDKMVNEARGMYADSDKKLDESTRRLGMMEDELRRTEERASLAESNKTNLENELKAVGENMIALENTVENALTRESKYKDQLRQLMTKLKDAEARTEYGEMNITKLNHRIDDIEDDIVREKMKIQKVNEELNGTFDDIFTKY